ncbi:MAG TPA: FIST N-terminal domain-containing protein [Longimicrobiaceae bacterium]|nr:FIST N-terminal domain-containing protein [Longimicrobiaceae bacterium]
MTRVAVALTGKTGGEAGEDLGSRVLDQLNGDAPEALLVFASPQQDHTALLEGLIGSCRPHVLAGCSSAGEFIGTEAGEGMTCVVGLIAPEMKFTATMGRGLRENRRAVAEKMAGDFAGLTEPGYRYRSALVLTDALAGFADDFVDQLTVLTGGVYKFFGGGAGDDARFERTFVFCNSEVATDAAVALEILSNKPIAVGVRHGWEPGGENMRVTAAEGMQVGSLNAVPAVEVFDAHAASSGQEFDHDEPVPFFLHNVLGVDSAEGYHLRVPLSVGEDGSVACAADVPDGSTACIMSTSSESAAEAAAWATRTALEQLNGHEPAVALLFDCVATRLRLGADFGNELSAVQKELGDVPLAGFNTYGQIAKAEGQFNGFHNCTAVVCVIPQ